MTRTYSRSYKNGGSTSFNVDPEKYKMMKNFSGIIALIMIGSMFFMMGFFSKNADEKRKKQCTYPVEAVVYDLVETEKENSSAVAPVFEFQFDDTNYRIKSRTYSHPSPYKIGDNIKLYINPKDPSVFYDPNKAMDTAVPTIFIVIGSVLWGVAGLIIITLIIKKRKKRTTVNHIDELSDGCVDEISAYENSSECIDEVSVYDETDEYQ